MTKLYNIKFESMLKVEADTMDDAAKIAREWICNDPVKYLNVIYIEEI